MLSDVVSYLRAQAIKQIGKDDMKIPEDIALKLLDVMVLSDEERLRVERRKLIEENPHAIGELEDPSPSELIIAVSKDPSSILTLKNPDWCYVQVALKKQPELVLEMTDPSEEALVYSVSVDPLIFIKLNKGVRNNLKSVQLAAIRTYPLLIEYVENPDEGLQLHAAERLGDVLGSLENPSKSVVVTALKADGRAIRFVKDQTPELQRTALRRTLSALKYIHEPCQDVCVDVFLSLSNVLGNNSESATMLLSYVTDTNLLEQLIRQRPHVITLLPDASDDLWLLALKRNASLLAFKKEPSEAMQLAAVSDWGYAIRWIEKPTIEVQRATLRYFDSLKEDDLDY